MILLKSFCLLVDGVSVAFEGGLGLLALGVVLPFELTDFFLPTGTVLSLFQGVLLLGDHGVSRNEHRFDFFFVSVVAGCLSVEVLFVF